MCNRGQIRKDTQTFFSSSGEVYFFIDQYTLASDANFRKNLDVDKDGTNFFRFIFPIHETSMSSSEDPFVASPFIFGQHPLRAGVDKGCDDVGAAPKAAEGCVERAVSSRL